MGINGMTGLKDDLCIIQMEEKTSTMPGNYFTTNMHSCDCEAPSVRNLSLQQPAVFYKDGVGDSYLSMFGCNVDNDSNLRLARNTTHNGYIQELQPRPYLSVPYMGRGSGNVCRETTLRLGEPTFEQRPCNTLAGMHIDRMDPLLPFIKAEVQNTQHIMTEAVDPNWIRGGQPSRSLIRNEEYLKACGYTNMPSNNLWMKNIPKLR
jgi:hypothetical protein